MHQAVVPIEIAMVETAAASAPGLWPRRDVAKTRDAVAHDARTTTAKASHGSKCDRVRYDVREACETVTISPLSIEAAGVLRLES
jgi:hypothetical protein